MDLTRPLAATLRFDEFWRWMREHVDCIVEAGTAGAMLLDFDDFHWVLTDDEEGHAIAQIRRGKHIIGEFVYEPSEILHVEGSPDLESGVQGQWLFELFGNAQETGGQPIGYFVLSHGVEEMTKHKVFKH